MKAELSAMFNVRDVARSVQFYQRLGFDLRWEWKDDDGTPTYAGVGIGDAVIALGQIPKRRGGGMGADYAKWVGGTLGGGVIVTVELRGVETIYARAKKAKAPIESPLSKRPYGTAFMINDPDGYVVRFLRPVGEFA